MNFRQPEPEAIYYASAHIEPKKRNYPQIILIGWFFAFLISLGTLGGYSISAPAESPKPVVGFATTAAADVFYVLNVNELRVKNGLKPVRLLVELNESSADKANHMAATHYWGHYDPDGLAFSDYIWKQVPQAQFVGENLARCFETRDAAFASLVASPTHYQVMVGDFNYIGVSEAYDQTIGCTIMAMHFARI